MEWHDYICYISYLHFCSATLLNIPQYIPPGRAEIKLVYDFQWEVIFHPVDPPLRPIAAWKSLPGLSAPYLYRYFPQGPDTRYQQPESVGQLCSLSSYIYVHRSSALSATRAPLSMRRSVQPNRLIIFWITIIAVCKIYKSVSSFLMIRCWNRELKEKFWRPWNPFTSKEIKPFLSVFFFHRKILPCVSTSCNNLIQIFEWLTLKKLISQMKEGPVNLIIARGNVFFSFYMFMMFSNNFFWYVY